MQTRLKKLSVPVALGVALATSVGAVQAAASANEPTPARADSAIVSEQTVEEQTALIFAAAGRNAMSLVESARHQLGQDNVEKARADLQRAGNILGQVRKGLELAPQGTGKEGKDADVIAIYAQLGVAEESDLTDAVRAELEALSGHIVLGEHEQVIIALERLSIPIVYRYVDMSVGDTLAQVETAMAALDANDTQKASDDLLAATTSLKSGSVKIGLEAAKKAG